MTNGFYKKKLILFIIILFFLVVVFPVEGFLNQQKLDSNSIDFYQISQKNIYPNQISNLKNKTTISNSMQPFADYFSISVSIEGDYAIIGEFCGDDNGRKSGAAYVFKNDGTTWNKQAKLLPSDGRPNDRFGWAVSLSNNYTIIGAYNDDDNGINSGSAYIFRRDGTTWVQEAKILPSDGEANDHFGISVAIDGDYAVVGADVSDDNGLNSGSAYIFRRDGTTWVQEAKILPTDVDIDDEFGLSVSIKDGYVIIGAPGDDDNSGSAYVFRRDGTTWVQEAKIMASDGTSGDSFGFPVRLYNDFAIIGSVWNNNNGSAYVFNHNGTNWIEQTKLLASDGAAEDKFGWDISISGDYVLIGVPFNDDNVNGVDAGSVYVFKYDGINWNEEAKLLPSDGQAGDGFGWSVSINGDYALIGSPWDDDNGKSTGSAYVFKRDGVNWIEQTKLNIKHTISRNLNLFERFKNILPLLRILLQQLNIL